MPLGRVWAGNCHAVVTMGGDVRVRERAWIRAGLVRAMGTLLAADVGGLVLHGMAADARAAALVACTLGLPTA